MAVSWNAASFAPVLGGAEGELVAVRIRVEPRLLEDLLEALASVPFPINPQIYHQPGSDSIVDFPAYSGRLGELKSTLVTFGFSARCLEVETIRAGFPHAARSADSCR